jgi:hypothetical protein
MHLPPSVDAFLKAYLKPPKGNSPQKIRERFLHWVEVTNHPENFTSGDDNPAVLSKKRRSARQCLKRLALRHPDIVEQLLHEHQQQPEAK